MNYTDTIAFLFNSLPVYQRDGKAAYKANLNNTHALDKFLNFPHKGFKSIHIAGTNGKGSVAHMMASVFQAAGYKTGLYTSPHLLDFRERIKVDGKTVEKDFVVDFVELIKPQISLLKPSFFEMTVAMAFQYFKEKEVDIAIIETGLGGRLDSTNIVTPLASVITNIGLDHTQFLGNTISEIANEKAGIMKPQVPTIIGETTEESKKVFIDVASKMNSELTFAHKQHQLLKQETSKGMNYVLVSKDKVKREYCTDLLGNYQGNNLITCLTALNVIKDLFEKVNELSIYKGLSNVSSTTGLRGRWEQLADNPKVICDTGHNAEGIKCIMEQLKSIDYQKLHIVWGMGDDKSADKILALLPRSATYYFTQANIPRAKDALLLSEEARIYHLEGTVLRKVEDAYKAALSNATKDDLVFVGGSTFVVADLLGLLKSSDES